MNKITIFLSTLSEIQEFLLSNVSTCLARVEGGVDREVDGVLGLARVVVVDEGGVGGDLVARREPTHQALPLINLDSKAVRFQYPIQLQLSERGFRKKRI